MAKKKKKQSDELKTEHLLIRPVSGAILTEDGESWYDAWEIALKKEGAIVGTARFPLNAGDKSAELCVEIGEAYRRHGYGGEAAEELADLAFAYDCVDFVEAEADPENRAARHLLEKLKYQPDGENRFVLAESTASYMLIFMSVGLALGLSFGTAMHCGSTGMLLGMGAGMLFGALLDKRNKDAAEKKLAERKARRNGHL